MEVPLDQVEFYMVGNNYTSVQARLDEIREKMPKFICLNDDMNKTHAPDPRLLTALRDFYISYFPKPSPFELPPGKRNPYLYIDELRAHLKQTRSLFSPQRLQDLADDYHTTGMSLSQIIMSSLFPFEVFVFSCVYMCVSMLWSLSN